jgi:hypothetical protein
LLNEAVLVTQALDDDLALETIAEPPHRHILIPALGIEGFVIAALIFIPDSITAISESAAYDYVSSAHETDSRPYPKKSKVVR